MANSRIKEEATITTEQVADAITSVVEGRKVVAEQTTAEPTALTQKIYVGPNLLGLPTYTVVETGFTQHIEKFIKECPEIEKLFVPILDMAHVESRLKTKGTLEHRFYNQVKEYKASAREGDK